MNGRSVRTKLALLYGLLFLTAGAGLLALSYGLVASRLPSPPARTAHLPAVCRGPAISVAVKEGCFRAYFAGRRTGTSDQRQRTLTTLLQAAGAGLLLATLTSLALGWMVAGRIMRPAADALARRQRFLANAAHELRTPLTTMRAAIEVTLAKRNPTAEQLEVMARQVGHAVERAQATVDAMLTLSSVELGVRVSELADLQVASGDALDATAAAIAERDVTVETSLESARVRGDPVLLERMVTNLIDNAVRYNRPGGRVSVQTQQRANVAVLDVTNSGPPVAEDALADLFEPFTRGHGRVAGEGGVGLGMSIAAVIVAAHRGTIAAAAQDEGGLRVTVTMPAA